MRGWVENRWGDPATNGCDGIDCTCESNHDMFSHPGEPSAATNGVGQLRQQLTSSRRSKILQVVPQQVQQLHNLQQQILQLQQWVQAVPLQLLQLQQLIHNLPHQLQQSSVPFQTIQPFGSSVPGLGAFGGGFVQPNVGITPQGLGYAGQTSVM